MLISTREVAQAQDRLDAAIADLVDADLRVASRCPGWTRGHVLTHLARNAEGMANLARWAMDDDVVAMYPPGRRDPDIEQGAGRGADEIRADVAATNRRALDALGELEGAVATDPLVAERVVRLGDPRAGRPVHARRLPLLRLQELVLHHRDLDLGGDQAMGPASWPPEFVEAALPDVWPRVSAGLEDPPTLRRTEDVDRPVVEPAGSSVEVAGTGSDLLAWITARADDDDLGRLVVSPDDADLPPPPGLA